MVGRPEDERGARERASAQGGPRDRVPRKEAGGRALGLIGVTVAH